MFGEKEKTVRCLQILGIVWERQPGWGFGQARSSIRISGDPKRTENQSQLFQGLNERNSKY